jgi:hypothetical protein
MKFLIGLIGGVLIVALFSFAKDSSFLRGQTAGSCDYCMTSIGNCVLEGQGQTCVGSARWSTYMLCSAGEPPCSDPGPTPPPPTMRYTYGACGSTCYQVTTGGWATQQECENAKAMACPTTEVCQSIGCTCTTYNNTWQCPPGDPMNPLQPPASSCQGSYCNVCTDATPPVAQCTYNGGQQGYAPTTVGPGQQCGWLWDNVMGTQCCTGTNWGALYPTMCDWNSGTKCYDSAGVELTTASSPGQTGICKTQAETLPACTMMGTGEVYDGTPVPIGEICQFSNQSCSYIPSNGGAPIMATTTAPCENNGMCTTVNAGGPMRCVAQECNSGSATICSDTPVISYSQNAMCGENVQPCCTSTGVASHQTVTCAAPYECMNGNCQIPAYEPRCNTTSGQLECVSVPSMPGSVNQFMSLSLCESGINDGTYNYMCSCRTPGQSCATSVAGCCGGVACGTNGLCPGGSSSLSSSRSSSLSSSRSSSAPSVCCFSNLPPDADICRPIPPPSPF